MNPGELNTYLVKNNGYECADGDCNNLVLNVLDTITDKQVRESNGLVFLAPAASRCVLGNRWQRQPAGFGVVGCSTVQFAFLLKSSLRMAVSQ